MDNEIDYMITDCEKRESKLSDWERGFIDSIRRQHDDERPLSNKQMDRLNEIWEKVTA